MIKNKTRNMVISLQSTKDNSFFFKLRGLMFAKNKKQTLVFEFKNEQYVPLHMMFVFFPIDVIWVDTKNKTVQIKENFKPFTFINNTKKAKYVIELPIGTIKKTKTQLGDRICIKP